MSIWEQNYTYAYYQLIITFIILGIVKLTDFYQQDALKKFATLPKWFWTITAVWELAIPLAFYLQADLVALYLTFTILGGIYYALFFIPNHLGKTSVSETYGLGLIPAIVTTASSVAVAKHHDFPLLPLILSSLVGVVIGTAVTNVKK